jgi:RimJ/RimL family protein N-acetyltransferase
MQKVTLETQQLSLRAPADSDAEAIAAAWEDPELQRWLGVPVPSSVATARAYVSQITDPGWRDGTNLTWSILKEDGLVGMIWVDAIADGTGRIGFWGRSAVRGQGLVSAAAAQVVDFALAGHGIGLSRLEWRAFVGNIASARVAQKIGFQFEGTLRAGALGRAGREDEWLAALLPADDRVPRAWPTCQVATTAS